MDCLVEQGGGVGEGFIWVEWPELIPTIATDDGRHTNDREGVRTIG